MKAKKKKVTLVSTKTINLGNSYEFSKGFANYLLKNNLNFLLSTSSNKNRIKRMKEKEELKMEKLQNRAKLLFDKINGKKLIFSLKEDEKGNVFGSIGRKEIISTLNTEEIELDNSFLKDFVPINQKGNNLVKINLGFDFVANLVISVNEKS